MSIEQNLLILAIIGFVVVAILVTFATRNRGLFGHVFKKGATEEAEKTSEKKIIGLPTPQIEPDLMVENVENIKKELRIMDVEKEIIGYALAHLYEAEAEGKINETDRIRLVDKYKDKMQSIEKEIGEKQMIVQLHDLEETKADLVEMFHSKLDEISRNIENIKETIGIQPKVSSQEARSITKNSATKVRTRSKAEEKIETVQQEVLKVLKRLEQIETEE